MDWARWWLFLGTAAVISATPGVNMLHVMGRSARFGFGRSVWAMAGCLTAVLGILLLSALGVGAVLAGAPRLFGALRLLGAAYLIWLGIGAIRGAGKDGAAAGEPELGAEAAPSAGRLYGTALLTGLSNPKAILFGVAFFPQFIDRGAPEAPQLLILLAGFMLCECSCYALYAAGGRRLARWLRSPRRRALFDRVTGGVFVLFGLGLLAERS
ncbi:MAG: LysE family translocator [Gluconacetobacter diazotrophicus]|nr:LysE family translocator [Gluconacetobacter diazotrophicus]